MKVFFIGPAGSGKGTHAKIASEKTGFPHISTGDLLRNLSSPEKEEAETYMKAGKLVPDEFIIKILKQRLEAEDCQPGFILDGFPRNVEQAKELMKITDIDKVIEMQVSEEEVVNRICNRLTCRSCGEIYHRFDKPPQTEGTCDKCEGELYTREDDNKETLMRRLASYNNETRPVLELFESHSVEVNGSIEEVSKRVLKIFEI